MKKDNFHFPFTSETFNLNEGSSSIVCSFLAFFKVLYGLRFLEMIFFCFF